MILAALDARERELGHTWYEIRGACTLAVVPTVVACHRPRARSHEAAASEVGSRTS